ncbi:MAG: hypothetical protein RBR59_09010 [Sulfurimonadaceae bacterium]|jgi:ABC-type Fe3+-hydroxamate transport system substrate-binding protein|nr:hypothetical protein [Sulfurimonadaceae bacterium]
MKKMMLALAFVLTFIGCSSKETVALNVPQIVVGNSMEELTLNDQFDKPHSVKAETQKIIFAFSKQTGHDCNDFLATKSKEYLAAKKILFVADISNAPSLVRSMFIAPGLKDFEHTILVLDEKETATKLRPDGDLEKIVVVSLEEYVIKDIAYLATVKELEELVGN